MRYITTIDCEAPMNFSVPLLVTPLTANASKGDALPGDEHVREDVVRKERESERKRERRCRKDSVRSQRENTTFQNDETTKQDRAF